MGRRPARPAARPARPAAHDAAGELQVERSSEAERLLWLVYDIPANETARGKTLVRYEGARPPKYQPMKKQVVGKCFLMVAPEVD